MWQPWSAALEWLGRVRFGWTGSTKLQVGDPTGVDARGEADWRRFTNPELLYDVWGPHPSSVWTPFHSVPLFAALERIPAKLKGPAAPPAHGDTVDARARLPFIARPGSPPPSFVGPETWVILDLPGPASVQAAAWLIGIGCQPVCTFDNWPHPKGLLRSEQTLAELIRWASTVAPLRAKLRADSPPVWICDSWRLGVKPGKPGEFDNRYYLDDATLPSPRTLLGAGIRRVVYVTMGMAEVPVLDFEAYFAELLQAGLAVEHADLEWPLFEPKAFAAPSRPRQVPTVTFRRSSAGGFGTEVPQPSSGGGG
jgi:hypothetical protein